MQNERLAREIPTSWGPTGECHHSKRLPPGVLKPVPRPRHLLAICSQKERGLGHQTGKPPETLRNLGATGRVSPFLAALPWGAETSALLETSSQSALEAQKGGQNKQTA